MTTSEIADEYIALREKHNVGEAASKTLTKLSILPQGLVDALGAEILNSNRPDFQKVQEYRNEVLSHFAELKNASEDD